MKQNNGFYTLCAGAIKKALRTRLPAEELTDCMANIKAEYGRIVPDFPEVGRNTLTDMAYLGCLFLAIYTGSENRFTPSEMEEVYDAVLARFKWMFGIVDLNKGWAQKKLRHEADGYQKWLDEHGSDYPDKWEMHLADCGGKGMKFVFTKCPLRDYCEKAGCLEVLPAICHSDFVMCEMMHSRLVRTTTLASGDCCDFWMMGDTE